MIFRFPGFLMSIGISLFTLVRPRIEFSCVSFQRPEPKLYHPKVDDIKFQKVWNTFKKN